MTTPLHEMTDEQLNIAIAKVMGAKIISKKFKRTNGWRTAHKWAWNGKEESPCAHAGGGLYGWGWNDEASPCELPNCCGSLDAMAEAEKTLPEELWDAYQDELDFQLSADLSGIQWDWQLKPRQRALAFLQVRSPQHP